MDATFDPQCVVASNLSVSDKIRRLAAAGLSRSQIAALVDRSYQQVRQVLVEDERRAGRRASTPPPLGEQPSAAGVAEGPAAFGGIYRLVLEEGGVIRLPPEIQATLQVSPGSVLIAELAEDRLTLLSTRAAWRKVQDLVASMNLAPGRLGSEELIAERRREAAREETGD